MAKKSAEDIAAVVARQRAWIDAVAAGIERGELPEDPEDRSAIAAILRDAGARLGKKPGRGNPTFASKLPRDLVPLMVAARVKAGEEERDAIAAVADAFDADESTVGKLVTKSRPAVDQWLAGIRVRALKGRRNSRE